MARICGFICLISLFIAGDAFAAEAERWVAYYGSDLPAEKFLNYDVIALDSREHPPLRPLQNRGKVLLGYLSLGEAENYRHDFARIKQMGVLLNENKHWKGHYIIDLRKPEWAAYVIEELIPAVLQQRFDGVMFDTLDGPLYLEEQDPVKYAGMKEAAVRLIQEIRRNYPTMAIMVNRGFEVLPQMAPDIDMILAESTLVEHQAEDKSYKYFGDDVVEYYRETIANAREVNPKLKVYSLDYWQPEDHKAIAGIYETQRAQGYVPYVSTIDLMHVYDEPK